MNSYLPKVSVITVCYNSKNVLEKTFKSLFDQTYRNIEYIVIDGKSNDGTQELIKEYSKKIFYWCSESDLGLYHAMNKGISKATGEWIYFLNADDEIFDKNTFTKVFLTKNIKNYDILYGDMLFENSSGGFLKVRAKNCQTLQYRMAFGHGSAFVKSTIMKMYKFSLEYKIAADYDFFLKAYNSRLKFFYLGYPIGVFKLGGVSTTKTKLSNKEHYRVIETNSTGVKGIYLLIFSLLVFRENIKNIFKKLLGKHSILD